MATLTNANSSIQLSIAGLFSVPTKLQGYAADDVFSADPLNSSELAMGVDGKLSAGFVFVPVKWSITLQADSASNDIFDQWYAQQQTAKDLFEASGIVLLPTINRKWTMRKGFLTDYPPMPDGRKILQPRKYGITWESISPAPV